MSHDINIEGETKPRRRFLNGRRVAIAAVVAGLTAVGIGAVSSQPQWGGPGGPGMGGPGMQGGMMPGMMQGGMGPGGMGHGRMMGMGRGYMFDRALSSVGATSEQKLKIVTIMQDAQKDMTSLRGRRYAAQLKLAILMKADTVDRAGLEKLRAEEFAAFEAASKRMTQAFADASEVLTPAQRKQLVERWENRWSFRR